ncbi:uncharacterized protein LOC143451350 isoform X2 [Clavelina lepadiformis]|uniref:uncharacterized protein LOC143451350 isoform X2 n=1 Tax=Clavelina lepadiformis TaxID=159417 RepID=UPI004042DF26
MDVSEFSVKKQTRMLQQAKVNLQASADNVYMMPSSRPAKPQDSVFSKNENNTQAPDDSIYMVPNNQTSFEMLDMSELRISSADHKIVTREVVTPDRDSKTKEERNDKSPHSPNIEKNKNLASSYKTGVQLESAQPSKFLFTNCDANEQLYVEAENATTSPTFRKRLIPSSPSKNSLQLLQPLPEEQDYIDFTLTVSTESPSRGHEAIRKKSIIVLRGETEYNSFVSSYSGKSDESRANNSSDMHDHKTSAKFPLQSDPCDHYLESSSNENWKSLENLNDPSSSSMGGKVSRIKAVAIKKKEEEKQKDDPSSKNPNSLTATDRGVHSVTLRKDHLKCDKQQRKQTTRPISMPFDSPPEPPVQPDNNPPLSATNTNPSQRPLPPTPLHIAVSKEIDKMSEISHQHTVLGRNSSIPQEPPPLPPISDQLPALPPRSATSFAPKLPYRPVMKHMLSDESAMNCPPESPSKTQEFLISQERTASAENKLETLEQDAENVKSLKNEGSCNTSTPTKKLHPIEEMIKIKQQIKVLGRLNRDKNLDCTTQTITDTFRQSNDKLTASKLGSKPSDSQIVLDPKVSDSSFVKPSSSSSCPGKPAPKIPPTLPKPLTKRPSSSLNSPNTPTKLAICASKRFDDAANAMNQSKAVSKAPPIPSKPVGFSPNRKPVGKSHSFQPPSILKNHDSFVVELSAGIRKNNLAGETRPNLLPPDPVSGPFPTANKLRSTTGSDNSLESGFGKSHEFTTPKKPRHLRSGYTLHKLQAERLASLENDGPLCYLSKREPGDGNDSPNNTPKTDIETSSDLYTSIEEFPPTCDFKSVSPSLSDKISAFNESSVPQKLTTRNKMTRSATFDGDLILGINEQPDNISRKMSLSNIREGLPLISPKTRVKPRPNVPPPPRPNPSIPTTKRTAEDSKTKMPPSRPPPPSENNIRAAKLRKETSRIDNGKNQMPQSSPKLPEILRLQSLDTPTTAFEEAMYSAIDDARSDTASTGSEEKLNASSFGVGARKKKMSFGNFANSVSALKNKLARNKVDQTNAPGNTAHNMTNDIKIQPQLEVTSQENNYSEEGIYVGIDEDYLVGTGTNNSNNSNIYLTSIPTSSETQTFGYAELEHGNFS